MTLSAFVSAAAVASRRAATASSGLAKIFPAPAPLIAPGEPSARTRSRIARGKKRKRGSESCSIELVFAVFIFSSEHGLGIRFVFIGGLLLLLGLLLLGRRR